MFETTILFWKSYILFLKLNSHFRVANHLMILTAIELCATELCGVEFCGANFVVLILSFVEFTLTKLNSALLISSCAEPSTSLWFISLKL